MSHTIGLQPRPFGEQIQGSSVCSTPYLAVSSNGRKLALPKSRPGEFSPSSSGDNARVHIEQDLLYMRHRCIAESKEGR